MPVLVTAADTSIGARLVHRLLGSGGEVRAFCRGGAPSLRAAGAIVAVGDLDDEGHLEAAMEQVHTVVHLAGGLLSPSKERVVADATAVVRAAVGARVNRVIALSVPNPDPTADPLRRAKAVTERLLREASLPTVVVRASLVDTPGLQDALAAVRFGSEELQTTLAPVRENDLVATLVALDEARSTAHEGHVVFHAVGPEVMTLGTYLATTGVAQPGGNLVGRTWRPPGTWPLLRAGLTGPWLPSEGDGFDLWDFTDVTPAPIAS